MQYQDCAEVMQTEEGASGMASARELAEANVNPLTGLASDYLNHFNEAIMLLELLSSCSECRDDFLEWKPKSYREHFARSRFKARKVVIAAYESADPHARECLDALAGVMTEVLEATRAAMNSTMPADAADRLAQGTAAWLRPLIARAAAIINGDVNEQTQITPQAAIDQLIGR